MIATLSTGRLSLGHSLGLLIAAAIIASTLPVFGADEGETFRVVGALGKAVKGTDFHEFTYYVTEGRKRKSVKALVKIGESVELLQDRPGRLAELKEGDAVRVFGLPEKREVIGTGGIPAGEDRFIRRASVVVTGSTKVNKDYKSRNPKDKGLKWCECQIEKPGKASISVQYEGATYRVSMDRSFQMIVRAEIPSEILEKARKKLLRKGSYLVISGKPVELPEEYKPSKRDADIKAYDLSRAIAVNRRTSGLYGTLIALE